jgi:hypothetical protein
MDDFHFSKKVYIIKITFIITQILVCTIDLLEILIFLSVRKFKSLH